MDELTERLKRLGEHLENEVPPVDASAIVERPGQPIDLVAPSRRERTGSGRRRRRVLIGVAVACGALVGGLLALAGPSTRDDPVESVSVNESSGGAPDDNGWEALRRCESNGDYTTDTGNTFYGAYQFTLGAWRTTTASLGMDRYATLNPAAAPAHVQDAVANALYLRSGTAPWPVCGRWIRGAMRTPVVPQWLGDAGHGGARVFLGPDVEEDRYADIAARIRSVVPGADPVFVDKEEAYREFQAMFSDDPEITARVEPDQLPPSFRLQRTVDHEQQSRIEATPGVFEVVNPVAARRRLVVPSLDLDAPVDPTPAPAWPEDHAVVVGSSLDDRLVIGGHGSGSGSLFSELSTLVAGDRVELWVVEAGPGPTEESVQYFEVVSVEDVAVRELATWVDDPLDVLVLVADVSGAPERRVVVRTVPLGVDLGRYGEPPA